MAEKIFIQVELGLKGVEKRDILVYLDGKLEASYFDVPYAQIRSVTEELRQKHPGAQLEVWCRGEDCCGKTHQWKLPF
ncbi:MAG: hypothetical protein ACUVSK_13490 [Desulfotomaculales bacterium]